MPKMLQSEHSERMFQLEHNSRFIGNTVEIAENSENHLKAIVGGRQMAGWDGVSG
jgi:hypothetical protein